MSPRSAAVAVGFLTLAKVFGGAAALWFLGAPGWVIAAWPMLHVTFRLDLSRLSGLR